jgi:hypothetical protein
MRDRKRQKKLMLSDEDLALLDDLCIELANSGVGLSQSDVVAIGLREIRRQGGVLETLNKQKKRKETA